MGFVMSHQRAMMTRWSEQLPQTPYLFMDFAHPSESVPRYR